MAYSGKVKKFDPEGSGYDYATAAKYGIKPDKTGHWQSRVPQTGQILKGQKHKTYHLTIAGEKEAGYQIAKGADGRYYSQLKGKKMAYSGSYKPTKGLGKPRNIREAKAVERRVESKYPGQKAKHAAAIKVAGESGLTKLAKRIRVRKKTKPKGAAKLLTDYAKRSGGY